MILNRNIKSCSLFLIITVLLVLLVSSCTKKTVKENLTALIVSKAYDDTSYECWVHNISEENRDKYKYVSELKVYNKDYENDYIFVYFFEDRNQAKLYVNDNDKSGFFFWLFSLIYGESTMVEYKRYDYIVVESYKNKSSKSRKDMIEILENYIYE